MEMSYVVGEVAVRAFEVSWTPTRHGFVGEPLVRLNSNGETSKKHRRVSAAESVRKTTVRPCFLVRARKVEYGQ